MPGLYQLEVVIIAKTALADKPPLRILVNDQVAASFHEAEAAPISCPPRELQPQFVENTPRFISDGSYTHFSPKALKGSDSLANCISVAYHLHLSEMSTVQAQICPSQSELMDFQGFIELKKM